MKCKHTGCYIDTPYASGYCNKHAFISSANKRAMNTNNLICSKKGCNNKNKAGRKYCELHDWYGH